MSRKPQNKRKRDTAYHPELHTRNVNSREIFKNDTLAYVISLIEHKSDIDYDVAMQLLRYMTVIWQDYKDMQLSLIHISEPTRPPLLSRMPSSA